MSSLKQCESCGRSENTIGGHWICEECSEADVQAMDDLRDEISALKAARVMTDADLLRTLDERLQAIRLKAHYGHSPNDKPAPRSHDMEKALTELEIMAQDTQGIIQFYIREAERAEVGAQRLAPRSPLGSQKRSTS